MASRGPRYMRFLVAGALLILLGLLMIYALPSALHQYIQSQLALQDGSETYPFWKDTPVPIYQKFYFYNVTNAQQIEQRGHKPVLDEIGPFTYRAEWDKRDIDQNDQTNTISYKHFKRWYFEPDMSIADHKLQLTTINAPLAITLSLIQSASNAVRLIVTFSLDGLSDGFFVEKSVKQLLFEGYPDLLTTFGPLLNAEMLSQGGHFGYMNAKNNSDEGAYEINTGVDDIQKLNTIERYNGKTKLNYWHNQGECNSLVGATTGDLYPPLAVGEKNIKMFQPDFCRVWRLDHEQDLEHPSGLQLKRFKATRDIFRNSTDLPENTCYFPHKRGVSGFSALTNRIPENPESRNPQRMGRQRPSQQVAPGSQQQSNHHGNANSRQHSKVRQEWPQGVFSLAPCKFNAPIYVSMPHFLDADPSFVSHVVGLQPDRDKHEFYVDLEPKTGSPVTLAVRAQINVAISKPPGLVRFRNIPEIMFPVFWQEFSVNVTGPVIDQLLLASQGADEILTRVSMILIILGAIIMIVTSLFYLQTCLQCLCDDDNEVSDTSPSGSVGSIGS